MLRRQFLLLTLLFSAGIAAGGYGDEQKEHGGASKEDVLLKSAEVTFHTKDDAKDLDTYVTAIVCSDTNRLASNEHFDGDTLYADSSDRAVTLKSVDTGFKKAHLGKIRLKVRIASNGGPPWSFTFRITLKYSDGTSAIFTHDKKEVLSTNQPEGAWDTKKLPLPPTTAASR